MKKRLGCLSLPGLVAALLVAAAVIAYTLLRGGGLFSPGALTASQPRGTPLGGYSSHAEFENHCALCHSPWLGPDPERCTACHAAVEEQLAAGDGLHGPLQPLNRCMPCHTDHQGRQALITDVAVGDFPHDVVGFFLILHLEQADGQPIVCADCHEGVYDTFDHSSCISCHTALDSSFMAQHAANSGSDCLACHDGSDAQAFDHATLFPLEGAHALALCVDCHSDQVFVRSNAECSSCHPDPHDGLYGSACQRCHNTVTFQQVQVDHTGLSDCQTCHATTAPPDHYPGPCDRCHASTEDWTIIDVDHTELTDCLLCHAATAPLDHYPGQCNQCHTSSENWTIIDVDHTGLVDCLLCHSATAPPDHFPGQCSQCHTSTEDWTIVDVDHTDLFDCLACHAETAPLDHFPGQCSQCHVSTDDWTLVDVDHTGLVDCLACHAATAPPNHYPGQCGQCHLSAENWQVIQFNHTGFTDCANCHAGIVPPGHYPGQCSQCHDTAAWSRGPLVHTFPFNHGDAGSDCLACHPGATYPGYTCYTCHNQGETAREHQEEGISDFGNCMLCHPTGEEGDHGGDDD